MASLQTHHISTGDCVIRKYHNRSPRVTGFTHLRHLTIFNRRLSTTENAAVTYNSGLSLFNSGSDSQLQTNEQKFKSLNDRISIESPRVSVSENLDEWMRKSVTEIVKNITQAPLLIQIYADGEVKTKKALPEKSNDWNQRSVEGVILVEELTDAADCSGEEEEGDRAYGVLIQGRFRGRDECRSSCYLLKTSGVNGGLGFGCRHFCLMKVKSFHDNVFSQFRDCWLVQ